MYDSCKINNANGDFCMNAHRAESTTTNWKEIIHTPLWRKQDWLYRKICHPWQPAQMDLYSALIAIHHKVYLKVKVKCPSMHRNDTPVKLVKTSYSTANLWMELSSWRETTITSAQFKRADGCVWEEMVWFCCFHAERIKYGEQLWERMVTKLKTFHTQNGVAKIFSERVEKWEKSFLKWTALASFTTSQEKGFSYQTGNR